MSGKGALEDPPPPAQGGPEGAVCGPRPAQHRRGAESSPEPTPLLPSPVTRPPHPRDGHALPWPGQRLRGAAPCPGRGPCLTAGTLSSGWRRSPICTLQSTLVLGMGQCAAGRPALTAARPTWGGRVPGGAPPPFLPGGQPRGLGAAGQEPSVSLTDRAAAPPPLPPVSRDPDSISSNRQPCQQPGVIKWSLNWIQNSHREQPVWWRGVRPGSWCKAAGAPGAAQPGPAHLQHQAARAGCVWSRVPEAQGRASPRACAWRHGLLRWPWALSPAHACLSLRRPCAPPVGLRGPHFLRVERG